MTSQRVGTAREVRPKAGWALTERKDGVTTVAQDDVGRAGSTAAAGQHTPTQAHTPAHAHTCTRDTHLRMPTRVQTHPPTHKAYAPAHAPTRAQARTHTQQANKT